MVAVWLADLAITAFGVCYPAYNTFKALKRKNMREYQEYIMYWIVYAAFVGVTFLTDLFLSWLPLYYELKVAFVIWMTFPGSKGHYYIYKQFIHRRLNEHEDVIDELLANGNEYFKDVSRNFGKSAAAVAVESLTKGQQFLVTQLSTQNSATENGSSSPFEILNEDDIKPGIDLLPTPPKSKAAQIRAPRASKTSKPKHAAPPPPLEEPERSKDVKQGAMHDEHTYENMSPSSWTGSVKSFFGIDDGVTQERKDA